MRVARSVADVALALAQAKIRGARVSFVPTMGAIHEGHLSLIKIAKQHSDFVVASIFVNPLQFNSADDFALYPRSEAEDSKKLNQAGVDLLFLPSVSEIYPGEKPTVTEFSGPVGRSFEGAARPGHFDGMLTVVARLFEIVQPDLAVFGAKDAQQLFLIRRMLREQASKGLPEIEIIEAPTVRDSKGFALSSRNKRLGSKGQSYAMVIPRSLEVVAEQAASGASPEAAIAKASLGFENNETAKLDYLALVDPKTFEPIKEGFGGTALAIVAATVGDVRLIDNRLVTF